MQVEEANLSFFRFIKIKESRKCFKEGKVTKTAFGQSPPYFIVEKMKE